MCAATEACRRPPPHRAKSSFGRVCVAPAAGKLKQRARDDQRLREMALEGVISIVEGMNPRMIEIKLASFRDGAPSETDPNKAGPNKTGQGKAEGRR